MRQGVSKLQVPNSVIVNKDISHEEFLLYIVLKLKTVSRDRIVKILGSELKDLVGWKDSRTIKKHLNNLEKRGLIRTLVGFRANVICEFYIEDECRSDFTQVDTSIVYEILHISRNAPYRGGVRDMRATCIRLFYYYEKNYNYELEKSFPSYDTIREDLGISTDYISALNELLERRGKLNIDRGRFYSTKTGGSYSIRRHVNNYHPLNTRNE